MRKQCSSNLQNAVQVSLHAVTELVFQSDTGVMGGLIVMSDLEDGRRKGSLNWSGMPCLMWSVDREAGVSMMYASNIAPFGDIKSGEMQRLFEKEMYRRLEESRQARN